MIALNITTEGNDIYDFEFKDETRSNKDRQILFKMRIGIGSVVPIFQKTIEAGSICNFSIEIDKNNNDIPVSKLTVYIIEDDETKRFSVLGLIKKEEEKIKKDKENRQPHYTEYEGPYQTNFDDMLESVRQKYEKPNRVSKRL